MVPVQRPPSFNLADSIPVCENENSAFSLRLSLKLPSQADKKMNKPAAKKVGRPPGSKSAPKSEAPKAEAPKAAAPKAEAPKRVQKRRTQADIARLWISEPQDLHRKEWLEYDPQIGTAGGFKCKVVAAAGVPLC